MQGHVFDVRDDGSRTVKTGVLDELVQWIASEILGYWRVRSTVRGDRHSKTFSADVQMLVECRQSVDALRRLVMSLSMPITEYNWNNAAEVVGTYLQPLLAKIAGRVQEEISEGSEA